MNKLLIVLLTVFSVFFAGSPSAYAEDPDTSYLELRTIDAGTFNEYRYLMGQKYLELKKGFSVNRQMNITILNDLGKLATTGKNYLPQNLTNENLYNNLIISLAKSAKQPGNANNFTASSDALQAYLENTQIGSIDGEVSVTPNEGNAPLNVSLRANVADPSGSRLENYNYTWWIDTAGKKTVIGNGPSINYTFGQQGNFGVFLDVESNHKNEGGYTDILPLRQKTVVKVNEKIASVILNVNNNKVLNNGVIKVSPNEAKFGIIFDATSSTPSNGSQFAQTLWDFGNGVKREYRGGPKVERVQYSTNDPVTVRLTLVTNEGITITRQFDIIITQPIAEIKASSNDGFLGDKFTFNAKGSDQFEGLNYNWEIVDITRERVIYKKSGTSFSYNFPNKGRYNVKLTVGNGRNTDIDTKTIYINSRPPVADFFPSKTDNHKPNRILLDGTRSYDPDFSDDGRLEYAWIIDGERVTLEDPNENNSLGYYTFDTIGSHSVVLVVVDSDNISHQKQSKVQISSTLSVDFDINPLVIQRNKKASFLAESKEAISYEWDFGDGVKKNSSSPSITHTYKKSGTYNVKLTVRDADNNSNLRTKNIYVSDADVPYAKASVKMKNNATVEYRENTCSGQGAYIANKVDPVQFSAQDSIDIDGLTSGLEYSWKIGQDQYFNTKNFSYGFDETGCVPVKLTVKSQENNKIDSETIYIKVENLLPTLNSLNIQVIDENSDPVVVNVSARGAEDRDGVIQSYLWYYYTDTDNEPQDFKSTTGPDTTFVLPKVTGNYYFVVVLKDSNEQRVNSEEATGEKFFITLAGDNVNTPLIDVSVSDSSVALGEEVVFSVKVENILGQDISNEVEYSWDFDGDGFYEKKTTQGVASHKFTKSGEYFSKVKVKNRGFSNVKTTTINVANKLIADFDYISIGDKVIFINTSKGEVDKASWELGDGTTSSSLSTFTHVYNDNEKSHDVTLKIFEGVQEKAVTKTVKWNPKNILESRKSGLNVFTYPTDNQGKLQLTTPSDNVFVYLAESEDTIEYFAIDYDTSYDSDLNGGKDDDEDNKAYGSYNTGAPAKIELNDVRVQNVKIIGKNEANETVEVYDLEITKLYIPEFDDSDILESKDIIFTGVSDEEKVKIEELKDHITKLPQEQRLKAMRYLSKLQEEWFDHTEKTRVIIEFEQYIASTGYKNSPEVIELLESLLVLGQEDKSDEAITYNALTSLIPETISCETGSDQTCRESLIAKIDAIADTGNIEEKTRLGAEVWDIIKDDPTLTDQQKRDFGAILKTYTYNGVENIPESEGGPTDSDDNIDDGDNESGGSFLAALKTLFKWILILLLTIAGIIFLFWIFYKLKNKDENIGFQDYIIDKTKADESDPLEEEPIKVEPIKVEAGEKVEKTVDPLYADDVEPKQDKSSESKKQKNSNDNEGGVPSWLAGASAVSDTGDKKVLTEEKPEKTPVKQESKKQQDTKTELKQEDIEKVTKIDDNASDEGLPDWLKGSVDTVPSEKEEKLKTKKESVIKSADKKDEPIKKDSSEKISNKKIEDKKQDTSEDKGENKTEKKPRVSQQEEKTEAKLEKSSDENLPDWLKGSMDETKEPAPKDKESKSEDKKQAPKKSSDKTESKDTGKKQDTSTKDKKTTDTGSKKKDELWDDGMDVPDWLKSSDDSTK